jgi:putative ABC transport system permease protein
MVKLVKIFVYATLSLTLLLGGMGVSTVMLAAVQDRTQEIGLRKALGAHEHIIMLQFLLEAVITSVFAGLVGVGLGFGAVYGLKRTLQLDVSESLLFWSCAVALGFTFVLGVLSGLYPSIRASRLDPVTAMRFE